MDPLLKELTEAGLLEPSAFERAGALLSEGLTLEEALVAASGLSEERLLKHLAGRFGVPYVDLTDYRPHPEFLSRFPAQVLLAHRLLPLEERDGVLWVATGRPSHLQGLDELRVVLDREVRYSLAPAAEVDRCIRQFLGVGADTMQALAREAGDAGLGPRPGDDENVDLADAADDASIVRFVNEVLAEALTLRATDVHIEPFEQHLRVRYRVDGVLQAATVPAQARWFQAAIVSRLKILSQLDIAEKRLPQDGRVRLKVGGRDVDVRVSVIPMLHGEGVVLRLLDRGAVRMGLERLGMGDRNTAEFRRLLELPHGIILVTGPTGSGKTTTLYSGLSEINDEERKILTIEDPVEYHLDGINQIQVSTRAGMSFALGLRSILRHDPDVILVGEIRDLETAEIAVQASLTGHLVFSTLHTNDAPGALTRLVDMGVEPYLVASSLESVLAQRLVRLVCPECAEDQPPADPTALAAAFGEPAPATVRRGRGCRACRNTGYRGRTGIFELMPVDETIRGLVMERTSAGVIRRHAQGAGMRSLRQDGFRLVCDGRTTPEEVLRVTRDEARAAAVGGQA